MRISEIMDKAREDGSEREAYACYHVDADDALGLFVMRHFLGEARKEVDLGKGRRMLFHRAHTPDDQDHVHFMVKGAKVYALNRDGSAHDRSHGVKMQRWAVDGLKKHHADFTLPPDNLIEALIANPERVALKEYAESSLPMLSRAARLAAELKLSGS